MNGSEQPNIEKNIVEIADAYECRAVEILTSINTGEKIGYCLGGTRWADLAGDLLLSEPVGDVTGFNLAYFSVSRLRREVEIGTDNLAAQKVLELRSDSNFLFTMILCGNVSINVLPTLLSN